MPMGVCRAMAAASTASAGCSSTSVAANSSRSTRCNDLSQVVAVTTIVRAGSEHLALVHPLFCDYRAFYKLERKEGAARKFLAARLERQDSAILLALDDSQRDAAGFAQLYPVFSSLHLSPAWILNDLF